MCVLEKKAEDSIHKVYKCFTRGSSSLKNKTWGFQTQAGEERKCHGWVREGREKLFFFIWSNKSSSSWWSLMRNTYEELSCIYIWLQVGGPVWVMGIRIIGFVLEEIMVIFLKRWGLQFIFLVRWRQQKGGEGERQSPSLPVPNGGSIYNTFSYRAQHTWDLRRSHFQRNENLWEAKTK